MAPETPPKRLKEAEHALGLKILARCPHCGGQNPWHLSQELTKCAYCDSLLWWPRREGEPPFLVAEDRGRSDEQMVDILATYDALRVLASIAAQRQEDDNAHSALFDPMDDPRLPAIHEIKQKRRHLIRIIERHRIFVPYQLVTLTLGFRALGRLRPQGRKAFRPLFFLCEEVLPAYGSPWNFRDRGLWLGKRDLQPLTEEELRSADFLSPGDVSGETGQFVRRYVQNRQLLEPDLDVVSFQGGTVSDRRWWLYRPYHFVMAETPEGTRWHLVDGQFGTIAGYPAIEEVEHFLRRRWIRMDALRAGGEGIRALGSRCPECGWDLAEAPRGIYPLCGNCGRLLEPCAEGLAVVTYRTVDPHGLPWPAADAPNVAWLPFWAVRCAWRLEGKGPAAFPDVIRALAPSLAQTRQALPASLDTLYVPAFPSWTYERYDAWAFAAATALTLARPETSESRLILHRPLGDGDSLILPTVDRKTASSLVPGILPSYFPVPMQVALNPVVLHALESAECAVAGAEMVYVPIPLTGDHGRGTILGPAGSLPLGPLIDGNWAPDHLRTVRRRMIAVRPPPPKGPPLRTPFNRRG